MTNENEIEEIKIPKPSPLKDFDKYIRKSPTFKEYKWEITSDPKYYLFNDKLFVVEVFNQDQITVNVTNVESNIWSSNCKGYPIPLTHVQEYDITTSEQKQIRKECEFVAQCIKMQIMKEAKELYLKGDKK